MNHSAPGNADRHGESGRALRGRSACLPLPTMPNDVLNDWLAELEPAQSAALGELLDHPFARAILAGIAEFSPYLFDLVRADAARLIRLLACDPEAHLAALIEEASARCSRPPTKPR